MAKFCLAFAFMVVTWSAQSQSIVGKWKTVDDQTGKERSIVEIYEKAGKYFGKILQVIPGPGEDPDPLCTECKGAKKDKKVNGLVIIEDMESDGKGEYEEGTILDPENGKVYGCKLWVADDGTLKVRGYLLFLYRTQTWLPYGG